MSETEEITEGAEQEIREDDLSSGKLEVLTVPEWQGVGETLTHNDKAWVVKKFREFLQQVPEADRYDIELGFVPFEDRIGAGTRADLYVAGLSVPSHDLPKEGALLQAKVNFLHAYSHDPTKTSAGVARSRLSEEAATYVRGEALAEKLGIGEEFERLGEAYMVRALAVAYCEKDYPSGSTTEEWSLREYPKYRRKALRLYRQEGMKGLRDEFLRLGEWIPPVATIG